ncbi:unnamed protein product [Agarophyton chilense]
MPVSIPTSSSPSPSVASAPSAPSLTELLFALDADKPSNTADALDQIRRTLPTLPSSSSSLVASALASLLRTAPTNLLLSHRAVAILAHPALNPRNVPVEPAIVLSMERLLMSAAFQHTALAALQNNASTSTSHRDSIVSAVAAAMRAHSSNTGLLLRGADLLAFHLTQRTPAPHTSTVRVAASTISSSAHLLCTTASGASTTLLALLAAARHISSLPFPTPRFSRASNAVIDDYHFASAIALAMSRHTGSVPVQMHGCELIRVSTAPATVIARHAAKEFYTAGCANAVVMALQEHSGDREVVNRCLTALRAMLLGGSFHGRALKPGLQLDSDFAEIVAAIAHEVSLSIAAKDRDLSSAAVVLAMDIRSATSPSQRDPSLSLVGKRIMRRIRFGHKLNIQPLEEAPLLNRRWRSVTGNRPRRTGSLDDAVSPRRHQARADRKPPLALTGSEAANLSRQPSNVFGATSGTPTRVVSMDTRVCKDTDRFRRHARSRMSVQEVTR